MPRVIGLLDKMQNQRFFRQILLFLQWFNDHFSSLDLKFNKC